MNQLLGAARLRDLLARHEIVPSKSLGQNFIIDPNSIRKVIDVAGVSREDRVLEIGAGAGSLTLGLAEAAESVVAVEFDRRLIPVLREVLEGVNNVDVVTGDALKLDLSSIPANVVVANLPYNIAASVVLRILEEAPQITRLAVMTQREVGERLAARPGSKAYGVTSVLAALFADARVAARISRRVFHPVPNVDSVLVRLDRRKVPAVDHERFKSVVKAAFSQRRKVLRNSLTGIAGSAEQAESALDSAGIDPTARAEDVDLDGYRALADALP